MFVKQQFVFLVFQLFFDLVVFFDLVMFQLFFDLVQFVKQQLFVFEFVEALFVFE